MDSNRIINYIENKETRKKYVTRRATEFFGGPEVKYFIKYLIEKAYILIVAANVMKNTTDWTSMDWLKIKSRGEFFLITLDNYLRKDISLFNDSF